MNNGSRLRNGTKSAVLASTLSSRPPATKPAQNITRDLDALLEQSDLALAQLTKILSVGNRRETITLKQLELLVRVNAELRVELTRISKEAAAANHLAHHDALTGLPNRRLLLDRLNQAIALASRQKKRVALVFFDVDGFKTINDKFGHGNGDKLLQSIARRLCACLRAADTACRYGGDEFIVLLPEMEGEQSASVVVQKIRAQLAAPYAVNGSMMTVTLSIGTAIYPDDAVNHRDLIKLADAAMYHSKATREAVSRVGKRMNSVARI